MESSRSGATVVRNLGAQERAREQAEREKVERQAAVLAERKKYLPAYEFDLLRGRH